MRGRLYLLEAAVNKSNEASVYVATPKLSWDQWHRRYGHIAPTTLNQISKEGIVDGLSIDQSTTPSNTCEACIQAKQAHKPFPKEAQNRSKEPGERVMSDVWGPARVESIEMVYFFHGRLYPIWHGPIPKTEKRHHWKNQGTPYKNTLTIQEVAKMAQNRQWNRVD